MYGSRDHNQLISRHQLMLGTAISFFMAGERCILPLKFGSYPMHGVSAPCVVNYALSIEIIMKIIIELSNENSDKPRGHNINLLYRNIKQPIRDKIKNNFNKEFSLRGFEEDLLSTSTVCADGKNRSIFETWRYSYEVDSDIVSVGFLREFFKSCLETLKNEFPEVWKIYAKRKKDFKVCPQWSDDQKGQIEILEDAE